jgi:hypothetical protein
MAQTKGILFSYVSLPDGFVPDNGNRTEMKDFILKTVDLTIKSRALGFGWYSTTGRKEITAEEYAELIRKCKENVPADYEISQYLLYLVTETSQTKLYNLTRDDLNRCLRPGAIKYSPAVYIVIEPTEVAEPTLTRPLKKPRSGKALKALLRIDALLDRLLTTL